MTDKLTPEEEFILEVYRSAPEGGKEMIYGSAVATGKVYLHRRYDNLTGRWDESVVNFPGCDNGSKIR